MTLDPTFHADAILRAAGSRLANYTLNGSRAAIVDAVNAVYAAGYQKACFDMADAQEPNAPPPKP